MTDNSTAPVDPTMRLLRVLIVDDSDRVRSELRQLLELSGEVRVAGEAADGQGAALLAEELSPDVVIMDLEMPVMNGYKATRLIKSQHPAPRVIVLSVHAGPAEKEGARAAGADGFVVKGASYQALLNAILGKDAYLNPSEREKKS